MRLANAWTCVIKVELDDAILVPKLKHVVHDTVFLSLTQLRRYGES
jgi:hypothetical protein